jgi:hypothetical protein
VTETDLFDFEQREPPEFVPGERLTRPDGTPVGHVGAVTNRPGEPTAYWSVRTRSEHRFKKFDGYAVSTSVLDAATVRDAETVFIDEEGGPVFEFDITQFTADGIVLDFDGHDRQLCVPVDDARVTWSDGL